jgi:hypothetical protein
MGPVIDINVAYQMCLLIVALVLDIEGLPVPQIITEKIGHIWLPDNSDSLCFKLLLFLEKNSENYFSKKSLRT